MPFPAVYLEGQHCCAIVAWKKIVPPNIVLLVKEDESGGMSLRWSECFVLRFGSSGGLG